MTNLAKLPAFDGENIHMVVETPRGCGVILAFDPQLKAFTAKRALALGITYPFDWGFVPSTRGEDGDPVDALALHDSATYPGVVLKCKPLGVVDVSQNSNHGREQNPRLILLPTLHDRFGDLQKESGLPERLRQEIEQFFLSATFFTGKDARIEGWRGPDAAIKLIKHNAY